MVKVVHVDKRAIYVCPRHEEDLVFGVVDWSKPRDV